MTRINFQAIRNQAEIYGLSGRELLEERTDEELAKVCNGIGAQWLDKIKIHGVSMSDYLNSLWPNWVVCACIHDIRYGIGGTEKDRKKADKEMRDNCIAVVFAQYCVIDIRRWRGWLEARGIYKVLREFGEKAFNFVKDPSKENKKNPNDAAKGGEAQDHND